MSAINDYKSAYLKLRKYCDHLEAERDILKEALKVYKSGRYPSLSLLDKIEEILKP